MVTNFEEENKEENIDEKLDLIQDEDKNIVEVKQKKQFYVVGIGASAGGLEALEQFFDNTPNDTGMAFVVVQHLSPDYKSLMVELLSKHTDMKVLRVEDNMEVEPNCVYLIPHKKNMTIFNGKLFLIDQDFSHGLNLPIDIFIKSLAEDYEEKSIAVILSGTGSDGTRGVRAIKEMGGMAMVQDENDAKFDGMPRSAIATGVVDYILPANKMGMELIKFIKHPYIKNTEEGDKVILKDVDNLTKILSIIKREAGVDFTYYKKTTVVRRIERRLSINQIEKIDDYIKYLAQNRNEALTLYKELLIGVTKFFRDTEAFEIIEKQVIPNICKNANPNVPIRVWSVACSTGEEAYSLAILFREFLDAHNLNITVKIFATDIDKDAIEFASNGAYPESIAADIPMDRLTKYFIKNGNYYQITKKIREMVIFASHNVAKDPPFYKIDLTVCRNMLIYLETILQQKIVGLFHFSLNQNGYLFLGSSETVGESSGLFVPFNNKWKIYQYKGGVKVNLSENINLVDFSREMHHKKGLQLKTTKTSFDFDLIENLYKNILGDFITNFVVVDEFSNILHIYGDVNDILKIPEGRINFNILKMVREDIATSIGTAIHKAIKDGIKIVYNGVNYSDRGEEKLLDIIVKPFNDMKLQQKYAIIIFENKRKIEENVEVYEKFDLESNTSQRIKDLEQELQYTKENLQATLEEIETSNEELQATNEELLAANEELQSTNEELQSVNEELITVNAEYQSKIAELTELSNDMSNLLTSTGIGTIFLDKNLCIRKFTPAITEEINLIEIDIGRPINHISHNMLYADLFRDAENVLKTLIPKEEKVQSQNGKWYLMKIRPYRTMDNVIKGVVLSFVDITDLKSANYDLEKTKEKLEMALDAGKIAWWIWDYATGNVEFHKRKAEMLGYTVDEFPKNVYDITKLIHPDDYDNAMGAMKKHLVEETAEYVVDYRIKTKTGNWKWLYDRGKIAERDQSGKPKKIVGVVIDISERKRLEESLKNAEDEIERNIKSKEIE